MSLSLSTTIVSQNSQSIKQNKQKVAFGSINMNSMLKAMPEDKFNDLCGKVQKSSVEGFLSEQLNSLRQTVENAAKKVDEATSQKIGQVFEQFSAFAKGAGKQKGFKVSETSTTKPVHVKSLEDTVRTKFIGFSDDHYTQESYSNTKVKAFDLGQKFHDELIQSFGEHKPEIYNPRFERNNLVHPDKSLLIHECSMDKSTQEVHGIASVGINDMYLKSDLGTSSIGWKSNSSKDKKWHELLSGISEFQQVTGEKIKKAQENIKKLVDSFNKDNK